ncbi:MAG: hypothetical protein AB7F74_06175 [Parvibaculaceae bacterium]
MLKRIVIVLGAMVVGMLSFDVGEFLVGPGRETLIPTAEARVGRPLTPMSVAGVTRRTVRRCAAGVYNC